MQTCVKGICAFLYTIIATTWKRVGIVTATRIAVSDTRLGLCCRITLRL